MLKPYPLSAGRIDDASLAEDKKTCRKIGPCGIGRHALYLNSFFIDRRYYVPFSMVTRVYKRVAMSKGGFSGKGIFATLSYLVVEFDGGQKVCNFKYEQQVDDFLSVIRAEHPSIPCVSADYLERRPELTERLSAAAKRRRNFQCTNGSYRWAAMAITLLGFAALAYGIVSFVRHGSFSIYFTLFGLAAIFTFAGFSVLPTARNNRTSIMQNDAQAQEKMQAYLADYLNFPLPARYAHPVVLRRMQRAVMDGRAVTAAQALDVVKVDLKALNADVTVSQEEYDEVVAIKSMFLNAEYQ